MSNREDWITCPRFEGHRLKWKHLNRHLWRCRENISTIQNEVPFIDNSLHSSTEHIHCDGESFRPNQWITSKNNLDLSKNCKNIFKKM